MLTQLPAPWPSLPREQLPSVLQAFRDQRGAVIYGAAGVGKSQLARVVRTTLDRESDEPILWVDVVGSIGDASTPLAAADALLTDI
ncbi:MAG: hypothetical protein QOJ72_1606, partial [Nocardioidaceae bacterium]|nr:hypothetical protein [Nocardioidaceae bacterium]